MKTITQIARIKKQKTQMMVNRLHHYQHRQNDVNWTQMHHPLQSNLLFATIFNLQKNYTHTHMNNSLS